MGFWDIVGKVGGFAVDIVVGIGKEAMKQAGVVSETRSRSATMSDSEIFNKASSSSGFEKAAYASELKNRGYSSSEIRDKIK